MFDLNLRLISMIGALTAVVLGGLVLDYLRLIRRPARLGLWLAMLGIVAGFALTLSAVLPQNQFYGTVFSQGKSDYKVVALTFDDGPDPPYTNQLLDILKENHVHATFFLIGMNAEKHPELVRRIAAEGHQIGNHTYHHIDLLKANRQTMEAEIDRTAQIIKGITGQQPHVVRPPHGFRDPAVLEVMNERGLKVVEWSIMSRDWLNPGVDTIVNRTLSKVRSGSVILLHDGDGLAAHASRSQSVEAARLIILALKAQGYTFVTIDELLAQTEGQ